MNLGGQTALVTGGAVRIGAAICRALAARGCSVVVHCNRSVEEAGGLAAELVGLGVRAHVVRHALDGGRPAELIDKAWDVAGPVDLLVNNASIFRKDTMLEAGDAEFRAHLEVNLLAPMLLTRRFAERLLARRAPGAPHVSRGALLGRIVNLLDRRVAHHEAGCVPYLVSKKALAEFTCSAAIELAPEFAVNGVAPGAVLPPPGKGEDTLWDAAGPVPLNARCRPEDVAEAVAWLLESDVVTGQIVYVDGGQHLL